jgi:hypothetical protein
VRIDYNTIDQDNLGTSCLRAPTKKILKTNLLGRKISELTSTPLTPKVACVDRVPLLITAPSMSGLELR